MREYIEIIFQPFTYNGRDVYCIVYILIVWSKNIYYMYCQSGYIQLRSRYPHNW